MKQTEEQKQYMKKYRGENKEHIRKVSQRRYIRNREKVLKQTKEWAKNNRDYAIKRRKGYYAKDKQSMLCGSKTRYYFPLKGHYCEFCGNKAIQHHHNTNPPEFDKFNYVCRDCHREIHGRLLVRTNKKMSALNANKKNDK